ncbi:hypothetical protein ACFOOM_22545 [Streptomyces echinoruber]|uniref:hypothetical protein n=1 Tax=Streptomyces echinoruber TaxID=68898 RepID=UPI00167ED579
MRGVLSAALIALSCLLVPFGTLAAWARYGLADTGRYVATMAPLAGDPDVRDAVADTVGAGILREIDARADLVSGPRRRAVAPFVHAAVRSFTATDAFRAAWDAGNRAAHDAVLHALRDEGAGTVTVDLAPVTAQVKDRLTEDHIPLAARIPVEHTRITLLPGEDVARLRKVFHVLEVAGFWLPVAATAFAAAGITLAACRRRALIATALGTALGGALLTGALAVGRRLSLDGLPAEIPAPAAAAAYDALTATVRTVSWVLLALGLTVALTSWLVPLLRRHRATASPPASAPAPAPQPSRARA